MIDPRVALVLGALYLAIWGIHGAVKHIKAVGHKVVTAIHKVVH